MAHFAELDDNNIVKRVIVVDNAVCSDARATESEIIGQAFCQQLFGADTRWVQTSYNGSKRFNYAGEGYTFDKANDAFIAPQPYPSWSLNDKFQWEAPVPYPDDGQMYVWNEETTSWALVESVAA
jgi:hypothetical protein